MKKSPAAKTAKPTPGQKSPARPKRGGRPPDEIIVVHRYAEDTPENRERLIEALLPLYRHGLEILKREKRERQQQDAA